MFPKETRVLVLDDMLGIRQSLRNIVRDLGFKDVVAVENGQIGYDLLCQASEEGKGFGLILSDWNMPQLSGIDLLKLVRIHPTMKTVPFLLVTAEGEYSQVKVALTLQVNAYVIKPFTPATIKSKLEQVWKQVSAKPKA